MSATQFISRVGVVPPRMGEGPGLLFEAPPSLRAALSLDRQQPFGWVQLLVSRVQAGFQPLLVCRPHTCQLWVAALQIMCSGLGTTFSWECAQIYEFSRL